MGKVDQIAKYAKDRGVQKLTRSDIAALSREYGPAAIEVLVQIMISKRAKAANRIAAAREILNRGYGTPTIHINPEELADAELEEHVKIILAKRAGGSEDPKALPPPTIIMEPVKPKQTPRKKTPKKRKIRK